jgi:hypothetical protein
MAANDAALLRLVGMLGASSAAAAAKAVAQEHRAVLCRMRIWTQDVICTLCPMIEQLWLELVLC